MLHTCFPYSPQDPEKYCIYILREEFAIPVGIFWVYLPQIIVLTPLPKICSYLSPSHTISSISAHLSFRNYDPQFLFTVLLWILYECFIVIAFCACTMSKRRRKQRVCDPIYCENPFCPQDGKEYSSMSAFTQHIGRSVSCQQFVQGHLVGTASLLCMTSREFFPRSFREVSDYFYVSPSTFSTCLGAQSIQVNGWRHGRPPIFRL